MKFTFETEYNQKALSVMAKCIRKTARAKHSKRSHVFGWIVIALALGAGILVTGEGAKPIIVLVNSANEIIMNVMMVLVMQMG